MKTQQELLSWVPGCFGCIALSNLLSFRRSLVNSFICWGSNMALLESSIIWHMSTAAQLLELSTSKPMEVAACSVGLGIPRMSSSVTFHWGENLSAFQE